MTQIIYDDGAKILTQEFALRKNVLWNSLGSTVYTICVSLTSILVVRLSNFAVAGNLSLAIAVTAIFSNIANYNIRSYQVSDMLPKYKSNIYISTRIVTSVAATILCLIFILFASHFANYSAEQDICIILYMFFKIGEAFIDVYYGIDQIEGRMDILSKSMIIRGLLILILFVTSLFLTQNLNISILLMGISTVLVAIFYDIPRTRKLNSINPIFDFKKILALLLECLPIAVNLLIASCLLSIPRFVLQNFVSNEALGIYTSVASPVYVIQLLSAFILTPILTVLAQNLLNNKLRQFVVVAIKCTLILIGISIISILGALCFGKIALIILFRNEIAPYYYLLLPSIYFAILQLFVNLISTILTVLRKLFILLISNIILLGTCAISSFYFIKVYGMQGANITLIVSTSIQLVFLCFSVIFYFIKYRKHAKIRKTLA
jgi:Membrane protein involved in the export of O-antigen and teichoic acid